MSNNNVILYVTQTETAETVDAIGAVLPMQGGIPPAADQDQAAVPPALQALLEGMQAQQVAMQAQLGLLPEILALLSEILAQLGAMQAQQVAMQAQLGAMQAQQKAMQAQLGAMQIEVRILTARASNGSASRPQDALIGLPNAANDLPQQFPHTLRELNTLTGLQLRDLLTFYGEEVPNGVEDRRDAFQRFIGMRL